MCSSCADVRAGVRQLPGVGATPLVDVPLTLSPLTKPDALPSAAAPAAASRCCCCRTALGRAVGPHLPPCLVLHGTADSSVPPEIAEQFVAALKVGVGGWEGGWPAGHVLEGRGGSCAALRCCCCAPSSPLVSSQTCLPHTAVALWLTHSCLRSCLLGAAAACLPACLPPQGAGVGDARLKLYVGKTHTRPIVEDPSE